MKFITSKSILVYGLLFDFGDGVIYPVASFGLSDWLLSFAFSCFTNYELYNDAYVYFYRSRKRISFRDFLRKFFHDKPEEAKILIPKSAFKFFNL